MKDNLFNGPEMHDPLDALLREADPYIPDDGFTARVLTSLPRRRRHGWLRLGVLSLATFAGAVLVVWNLPAAGAALTALPRNWSHSHWQALLALLPGLAALASLGWGLFALVNEEE